MLHAPVHLLLDETEEKVLLVTINRPEVSNAANTQTARELLSVFSRTVEEPNLWRAIVITGAGDKAFCAGGDLKERNGMTDAQWQDQHLLIERMIRSVIDCPVPTIAAVNGAAYAGGLELALCCDFIYAVDTARFALTETRIGIMPGAGGTQNLARAVGERRAKEIILTAEPFDARQAYEWNLVNRLSWTGEVVADAVATAKRIATNAPLAARQAKHAIHFGLQGDLRTGLMFEIEAYNRLVTSQDRLEGVRAFNEKRKPNFVGR
jgi:enoyl-CoA hydratase/carnithine racemase